MILFLCQKLDYLLGVFSYLQLDTLRVMCFNGNEDCIAKSREYYNLWIGQNKPYESVENIDI